jgi:hypothetical protein
MDDPGAFPAPDTRIGRVVPGCPSRRQAVRGQRLATGAGRGWKVNLQVSGGLTRAGPAHDFASITSTAPGQRHHGDMRWPRRPHRVASLTPRGRQFRPAPEPWWGRPIASEPGVVLSPGGWTPPPEVLPAWNWLPSEGAAPRLDLVPWWARVWYHLPFIDRYAHAWMWRHGAWEVRPPNTELGHIGGTD